MSEEPRNKDPLRTPRPGNVSRPVSPVEAKMRCGRGSFFRTGQHQGNTGAHQIEKRIKNDLSTEGMTEYEWNVLRDDNPIAVANYLKQGMTREEIFKILND